MADHKLEINDAAKGESSLQKEPPKREKYRVVVESGIFKNGSEHAKDSEIELDEKTAENFLRLGEVEKI